VLFFSSLAATGQLSKPADPFDQLSQRAASARDDNRLDEAISLYRRALAFRPKWAEGWWSLGTIEYDRSDYAAAAADLKRLLPLAPKDGTAQAMLGLCEFELGQDKPALSDLQAGSSLGLASDRQLQEVVYYHEGTLLLRSGHFKIAQATFALLCKQDIETERVDDGMGMSVLRALPNEAPTADSTDAAVIRQVGHAACLVALKRFDEANGNYNRLLESDPAFPNIHYAFGLALIESNDIPRAVDQFKIAISQNPGNAAARLEIAAALYKVDSATALPYAEEAARLNPRQPFAHYLLGLLLLDTDHTTQAIPELEIAAKAFPREKRIFFALASAYSRAGRRQDAEKARASFEQLNRGSKTEPAPSY
jgi:tetratricopeptide (TPR) repeat protein